jgi:hypothetical protein
MFLKASNSARATRRPDPVGSLTRSFRRLLALRHIAPAIVFEEVEVAPRQWHVFR